MKIRYEDRGFSKKSLARISQANAIIDEYQQQDFILTLRQLYYQHVAKGLIENSERSYKSLGKLIANGRMAGLISWQAIEDRSRSSTHWRIEECERDCVHGIERRFALDFWQRQGAYIEVWIEKEALVNVIERSCGEYRVPYMACKGYLSLSEAWRAARRFRGMQDDGRRCVLIHLGDHDPSGIDMTRDNDDRLDILTDQTPIEIRRIALNMDQIEVHDPPPNPAKITDTRAAEYIKRFGGKSWELD